MPVDKFGHTDTSSSKRVISGGVTLSQINNLFLRCDGANSATGNIDLKSHALINVATPTNNNDAATKSYVDTRIPLPSTKFLTPCATGISTYTWKAFQEIPSGFSVREFDELPTGFYACYTGYIPTRRLGSLPVNKKGYLTTITYQQPTDRNKYYMWINSANGDEWRAYFKSDVWTSWVNSSKVSKSGDTMTGDLNMSGKLVKGLPITYPPLYSGNEAVSWAQVVKLVADATTNNSTVPIGDYYLTNKKYVDTREILNYDGHIPPLSSNYSQTGFTASASSYLSDSYAPFYPFLPSATGEWATAGETAGEWLQISCPSAVRIWKIRLRGRSSGTDRILSWSLFGGNNTDLTGLLISNTPLGNTAQEFLVTSTTAYSIYAIYINSAEGRNPGLSHFQIFTRNI